MAKIGRPAKGERRRDPWGNVLPRGVSWRAGAADGLYVALRVGGGPGSRYCGSFAARGTQAYRRARIAELARMAEEGR